MRHVVIVLGCLALSSAACVEPPPREAPTTAVIDIRSTDLPKATLCWALATRDASGAETASWGTPGAPADLAAALAAGAACASSSASVDPIELACAPGAATLTTWLVGAYDADGARLDVVDSCGADGCEKDFTCVAHAQTPVRQDLTVARAAHQGFFDIGITVADPGQVKDLCGTLRVVNGAGVLVWKDDVCASALGDGHSAITYVGPCSSDDPAHTVTLWLDDPEPAGADPIAWTNPCPGSRTGEDALAWTGGCSRAVDCPLNEDVIVDFDFSQPAPR